jgi:hypothetical protein
MRYKRGYIREDGLVFLRYKKDCKNGEIWKTREEFQNIDKKEKEAIREWRIANQDHLKNYYKNIYSKNKEKIKQIVKEWYLKNKDKSNNRHLSWVKNNKEKWVASCAIQRAKKRKLTPNLSKEEKMVMQKFYLHAKILTEKLGIIHHVDHVVPLAKGGIHHPSNLQVIPASVNLRKGAR